MIGFESLPKVEAWYVLKFKALVFIETNKNLYRLSQKVEIADSMAAPYLAKSAPLVISAYDKCRKTTCNLKVRFGPLKNKIVLCRPAFTELPFSMVVAISNSIRSLCRHSKPSSPRFVQSCQCVASVLTPLFISPHRRPPR